MGNGSLDFVGKATRARATRSEFGQLDVPSWAWTFVRAASLEAGRHVLAELSQLPTVLPEPASSRSSFPILPCFPGPPTLPPALPYSRGILGNKQVSRTNT